MIEINQAEVEYLRSKGVKEGITRSARQDSKRKHYYLCEDRYLVALLNEYRNALSIVETYGKID